MRILGMRGRRLESVEKAKKELGLTLLGELPLPSAGAAKLEAAYTHLFQETLLRVAQGEAHRTTLAVTSTREGEGRTSVAANLALAAARQGRSVLLVDTEVRNPMLHRIFGGDFASPLPGLLDLLAMAVTSPSEVLLETSIPRLRLLPIGDVNRHDPVALLSSARLERFVRNHAPRLADIVIFDTPHVLSNEPGRHVLSHVDGSVFVVGLGELEASSARKALERLERYQARVLGGAFLSLGSFPSTQAIPLPEVTLQKPGNVTNTLSVVSPTLAGEHVIVTPPTPSETEPAALENESDGMSMNVAAQKRDDDQNGTPEGGFGVEDLEAVLQGWRRRDSAATPEATPVAASDSVPISLPPLFNGSEEASEEVLTAVSDTPEGIAFPLSEMSGDISAPFLSVATNEEAPEAVKQDEKPILTLVDENEGDEPEVLAAEPAPVEDVKQSEPVAEILVAEPEVEEPVIVSESTSSFVPVIPAFPVPVMASESPAPEPVSVPVVEAPVVVAAPVVVEPVAIQPIVVAPEPVAYTPEPAAAPSWHAAPVVAPTPVMTVPPVAPLPAPAPVFAPVAQAPILAPTPAVAPPAPVTSRAALDMQIDMFQTGPGEMTMRAATSNAPAAGVPPVSLELGMAMNAMRGMRAITPTSNGGPDQPRIALEAVSTDAPEATRMRLVVGSTHEPALEVVVHNGAGISVRTGTGYEQPSVKLDSQNLPDGGSVTRATLFPARGGQEMVLELRREAVNDGFTDARWKNRLSLFA